MHSECFISEYRLSRLARFALVSLAESDLLILNGENSSSHGSPHSHTCCM